MSIKYIMLSVLLCCFTSGIVAQNAEGILPSEETKNEIDNYAAKSEISPFSKPGGGPGVGEVETPISDYSLLGLITSGLLYVSVIYIRKKKKA